MISRVLFALVLVLAILYLWQRLRLTKARAGLAGAESGRPKTLRNVGVGGVVSVRGLEEGEKRLVISKRNRYSQGGREWLELVADDGREPMSLQYEEGHRFSISLLQPVRECLADLGLDEDRLIRFDEEGEGVFEHAGTRWCYSESAEAFCHEGAVPGPGEGFYYWHFEEVGGPRSLTIERYVGQPFTVWRGRKIPPEDVSVRSLDSDGVA